jgi:hypothetical protein
MYLLCNKICFLISLVKPYVTRLQTVSHLDEKRITDLLSGSSDTTWELLGTRQEDLMEPIEIDIHKHHRYDISGESRNAWGFLGLSIDTTVTRIVTIHQTKRILDSKNTVTMLISGCKPTILPFHVPLCEEDILPTVSNNVMVQPTTQVFDDTESISLEQEETTIATEPLLMVQQKVSNSQIKKDEKIEKNVEEKDNKNKEILNEEEKKTVEVEKEMMNEKSEENMNEEVESETEVFALTERSNVITDQPLITEEENKDLTSTTEAVITTLTTQQEENALESENTTPEPKLEPVTEHIFTIEDTISAVKYLLESSHSNNPMHTVDILPIVNHEMMETPDIEMNNMEMTTDGIVNMNEESMKQIEGLQVVYVPHEGPVAVEDADTL